VNTAFNLLQYPMQVRQRRWRWRVASSLTGGVIGLLLAAVALHHWQQARDALEAEHVLLLTQTAHRRAQAVDEKLRLETLARLQGQQQLLAQVQHHQQAWVRLYQAILQEAPQQGWALERLQVEGDRLELQGRLREAQALAPAQARLSQALQSPLTLVSLMTSPADPSDRHSGTQVFVWQGPWPALPTSLSRSSP
jgi:hypothetical protein